MTLSMPGVVGGFNMVAGSQYSKTCEMVGFSTGAQLKGSAASLEDVDGCHLHCPSASAQLFFQPC